MRLTHLPAETGISLIEVMISLVLAMIASLVVLQVSATFEGRKRTTTGGADAQSEGMVALYTVERDARDAGYGISMLDALGCTVNSSYNRTAGTFSLTPVTLVNGANGAPDSLRVLASEKALWSVPVRLTRDHPPQAANMFVNTTQGMEVGDMVVAYQAGKECTLFQITGVPNGNPQIHHGPNSPWNPAGGHHIFPRPDGYTTGAFLFNLGQIRDHTYSVNTNGSLQLAAWKLSDNTTTSMALVPHVANFQAQYGFDTRAGKLADARVTQWSDTMIDADGDGVAGDHGDISRIFAVRLAVVTRSVQKEKPKADGTCDVTTVSSDNRPRWAGGEIDVSRHPDGSNNTDWNCYRYKVLESVVPLRNMLWREQL